MGLNVLNFTLRDLLILLTDAIEADKSAIAGKPEAPPKLWHYCSGPAAPRPCLMTSVSVGVYDKQERKLNQPNISVHVRGGAYGWVALSDLYLSEESANAAYVEWLEKQKKGLKL